MVAYSWKMVTICSDAKRVAGGTRERGMGWCAQKNQLCFALLIKMSVVKDGKLYYELTIRRI